MYGGSKEEMQKLLADAEKFSGVKYDITNLNDVFQAIHVIQEQLDITGTTAKEAATTLNGAFATAKSAFTDFLSGAAEGTDPFVDSFINLTDIVIDRLQKLIPRLTEGLSQIVQKLLPKLLEQTPLFIDAGIQFATAIVKGITDNIPLIVNAVKVISVSIISALFGEEIGNKANEFFNNLGKIFQDAVNKISPIIQTLSDSLKLFFDFIINNQDAVISAIVGIGAAFAVFQIGTLATQIISFITTAGGLSGILTTVGAAFSAMLSPVLLISAAIGALVFVVMDLWKTNEEFRNNIISAWESIQESISRIIDSVKEIFTGFITDLQSSGTFQSIKDTFVKTFESIQGAIKPIIEAIANLIEAVFGGIADFLDKHGEEIKDGLVLAFKVAWDLIKPVLEFLNEAIKYIGIVFSETINIITAIINGDWSKAWESAGKIVEATKDIIVNGFNKAKDSLISIFSTIATGVKTKFDEIKQNISTKLIEIKDNIINTFKSIDLVQIGKDIIQGLINGITSMASGAVRAAGDLATGIKTKITGLFDIHSPSKWAEKMGQYIDEGLANGIEKSAGLASKAAESLFNAISGTVDTSQAVSTGGVDLETEKEYQDQSLEQRKAYHEKIEKINNEHNEIIKKKNTEAMAETKSLTTRAFTDLVNTMRSYAPQWYNIGQTLMDNLIAALQSKLGSLQAVVSQIRSELNSIQAAQTQMSSSTYGVPLKSVPSMVTGGLMSSPSMVQSSNTSNRTVNLTQNIAFNQPVSSPAQNTRAMKSVSRGLAYEL